MQLGAEEDRARSAARKVIWPLVGREAEITAVQAALAEGRHVAVLGAAGLGKTRLVEEATAAVAATGVVVRWVVATPGDVAMAMAPFLSLIEGRLDDPLGAVLDALGPVGGAGSPVLIVDDAHQLDPTAAALVHQLAVRGRPGTLPPVRLVLLARSGVELPDPVAAVLAMDGTALVQPRPLDEAAAREALSRRLGGRLEPHSADRIVGAAQGSPLYLREIVEGALSAGALVDDAGLWRLRGQLTSTPVLEDVVLARILGLSQDEIDALEALAVAGELDLAVIGRSVAPEVLERLERAEHLRVRAVGGRTLVDVGHPLVRELLRDRLPALAVLRLCRILAESTEAALAEGALGDRPEVRVQGTVWRLRGGMPVGADALFDAATAAVALGDTALGAELAAASCEVVPAARPALLASWCLAQQGRHDEAIELIERFRPAVETAWDRAAMDLRISEEHWWGAQDTGLALAALRAGIDGAGEAAALLEAQLGVFAMLDGRIRDAAEIGSRYLEHSHPAVRFCAGLAVAHALAYGDRGGQAAAIAGGVHADLQREREELFADLDVQVVGLQLGLLYDGRLEEAQQIATLVDEGARARPDPQPRAWGAVLAGCSALVAGQLEVAVRRLLEAELLWIDCGLRGPARWCATGVALAAAGLGEWETARAAIGRMEGYPAEGFGLFEPLQRLACVWLAVADHDDAAAVAAAREAADLAVERGAWAFAAWIAHDLARLDLVDVAIELVGRLPAELSPLAQARVGYVEAVSIADAGGLDLVAEQFEAMGAKLFAAEAHAGAARLRRRSGRRREALLAAGRSAALLDTAAVAATPPLGARVASGPLSPRERQVAELAAAGRANKEIAAMLVVSERTVENHLYRTFIKLGIGSRAQLADALGLTGA